MEQRQITRWDGKPVDKAQLDDVLMEMERIRERAKNKPGAYPVDYVIRLCEAAVAEKAGYPDRASWQQIQRLAVGLVP